MNDTVNHEEWKDIPGYEGIYQASNLGNIRGLDRLDARGRRWRGSLLTPSPRPNGYLVVILSKNNERKTMRTHRIVMITFNPVDNPEELEVNHINGIKDDNRLENLEWNTRQENMKHAYENKLIDNSGEKHGRSKLTWENVNYIRKNHKPYNKQFGTKQLAKEFNVSEETIRSIIKNKSWKEII